MRAPFALVLSGCTLVVGSDPRVDVDADVVHDAQTADEASPPEDEGKQKDAPCDAAGCSAAKNACKTTCANAAKKCNDGCSNEDGKSCHDLCNQQLHSCNDGCLATCLQCVTGCGTCSP